MQYKNGIPIITDTTVNNSVIGGTTPAAGSFTTGAFSSTLTGQLSIITHDATEAITAAQSCGHAHKVTGAYTLSLDTAAAGLHGTIEASTAAVFSVDLTTGTDIIILNGTALAAGNKVTSDGTLGAKIHYEATEAGYYRITSILGLHVDGGA